MASTTSAFDLKPHSMKRYCACIYRLSADTWPQQGLVRLVLRGGTVTRASLRSMPACRQLAAELEPALIEDGFVQSRVGPNVSARHFGCTCRRPGHVPHLQVLDTHRRVVLVDRGRGLVQVVAASIADAGMNALDNACRLFQLLLKPLRGAWNVRPETAAGWRQPVGTHCSALLFGIDVDRTAACQTHGGYVSVSLPCACPATHTCAHAGPASGASIVSA